MQEKRAVIEILLRLAGVEERVALELEELVLQSPVFWCIVL